MDRWDDELEEELTVQHLADRFDVQTLQEELEIAQIAGQKDCCFKFDLEQYFTVAEVEQAIEILS